MINLEDIIYLEWIFNRLLYKFQDDIKHIQTARTVLNKIKKPDNIKITDNNLNKILSKYFVDFNLQKIGNIGFDDKDRTRLRDSIRLIVNDILINNIPKDKDILIK